VTINEARNTYNSELSDLFPPEEIRSFFAMLASHWMGYSRLELALHSSDELTPEVQLQFSDALARLKTFEPVQYIIGTTEFYGQTFEVTPDTLIPRPETEELVDWIIKDHKGPAEILDIGTGTGCIAVSLAKHLKDSVVSATDISAEALKIAGRNAERNDVVVRFSEQNILKVKTLPKRYDIIVSNPPYVRFSEKGSMRENVLHFEPESALYVPDDDALKFYRQIAKTAYDHLKGDGCLFFEINEYLGQEMVSMLKELGFGRIILRQDFRGRDRFIKCTPDSNEKT
jgi:release factor glutamine methyltransferase